MKSFVKKAMIAAGLFVGVGLLFFCHWFATLRPLQISLRAEDYLLENADTAQAIILPDGETFTFAFKADCAVYRVGFVLEKQNEEALGTLDIRLLDNDKREVLLQSFDLAAAVEGNYSVFTLPQPVEALKDAHYTLQLTAHYTQGTDGFAVRGTTQALHMQSESGEKLSSDALQLLVSYDVLGGAPMRLFFAVALLCSLGCAGLYLLFAWKKVPLHLCCLAVLLFVGAMYQVVNPPFVGTDESEHYMTSYRVSNVLLGDETLHEAAVNKKMLVRAADAKQEFAKGATAALYRDFSENWGQPLTEEGKQLTEIDSVYFVTNTVFVEHLGSGVFLAAGRMMGLNTLQLVYFGRVMSMIVFALAVSLAVKIAPFGKSLLIASALMPGCMQMVCSYKRDWVLLCGAYVVFACTLALYQKEKIVLRRDYKLLLLLCASGAIFSFFKFVYAPVFGIIVLMLFYRQNKTNKRLLAAFAGVFALVCLLFVANLEVRTRLILIFSPTVQENLSVGYLLANPGIFLSYLINFVKIGVPNILIDIFGRFGSRFPLILPLPYLAGFIGLLAVSTVQQSGETCLARRWKIGLGGAILVTLTVILAICISWTSFSYSYIWGFGGRYIYPLLPFLLALAQGMGFTYKENIDKKLLSALAALQVLTCAYMLTRIMSY